MYYINYSKCSKISNGLISTIIDYYEKLFTNCESKCSSEICSDLDIDDTTLRRFWSLYCPTEEADITKLGLKILLCTKFKSTSPYYELQKNYLNVIKRREITGIIKSRINETNKRK